jgi:NADP-dependent 3-hydroxy acid dehydrogenase YdfG
LERRVAVITGASSGIGAACATRLVAEGFDVVLGARRLERLGLVAAPLAGRSRFAALDVTDTQSVEEFCAAVETCHLLVNCAGGALGTDPAGSFDEQRWRWMYEANVLGVARMTRALLPKLIASGDGQVITIGSVAGFEPYTGGAGYNAAKFGVRAVMEVLRLELLGQPVRISLIDPGMVQTEFSLVRFDHDQERADALYQDMIPLTGDDVADCVAFVATRPSHVDIERLVLRPRDQARVGLVHRHPA